MENKTKDKIKSAEIDINKNSKNRGYVTYTIKVTFHEKATETEKIEFIIDGLKDFENK